MGFSRWFVRVSPMVIAAGLIGCQPAPAPTPPAPPPPHTSRQDVAKMKMDFAKADPNARVGDVAAVRSQDTLVAVEGMSLKDIRTGAAVSFVDSDQNVVANGIVDSLDKKDGLLIVRYVPTSGGRAPNQGDGVIWFMPTP